MTPTSSLPVIDISRPGDRPAREIEAACRDTGFFYVAGGWYRSTLHRVRNVSGRDRLSYPFFFDPDFTAEVPALPARARTTAAGPGPAAESGGSVRWDDVDLRAFEGTYGDYLLGKVSKVFPQLSGEVL